MNRTSQYDERVKGYWVAATSSFTADAGGEKWTMDLLGNWAALRKDTATPYGTFDGDDTDDDRTHNGVNELTDRDLEGAGAGGGTLPLDLTYDHNGNLVTEQKQAGASAVTWSYTYDAWNRLVRIETGGTPDVRAEYEYNGLNWRTVKKADTTLPADGTLDQQRIMYYSPAWQLLEERIDDDLPGADGDERHVQYVWGPRYIDDIILHRKDGNMNGSFTDSVDETWYHLTDAQFSTVAVLDDTAKVIERVSYSAYGEARHHVVGDVDGDGGFGNSDYSDIASRYDAKIGEIDYASAADLDRDGTIDAIDMSIATGSGSSLPAGQLSDPGGVDNPIGWDGYVFNAESLQYQVRFRTYSPPLGRWTNRDPIPYLDSTDLYLYGVSNPVDYIDPSGWVAWKTLVDAFGFTLKDEEDDEEELLGVMTPHIVFLGIIHSPNLHGPAGLPGPNPFVQPAVFEDPLASIRAAVQQGIQAAEPYAIEAVRLTYWPIDAIMAIQEVMEDPTNPWRYAAILPFCTGPSAKAIAARIRALARAGEKLRPFTRPYFAHNLEKFTGHKPAGHKAHHVFPDALEDKFAQIFGDPSVIHAPWYGWWAPEPHYYDKLHRAYNKAWRDFLSKPRTPREAMDKARELMEEFFNCPASELPF